MSEPSAPGQPPKGQDSIDRRAWSKDRQWRVIGIAAASVVIVVLAVWLGGRAFGPPEAPAAAAPSPPGTFRATPQQLKTLTVEVVRTHGFVTEELTEGKIAVNGDRATPVFSPYSGRVTRVIAGLGDVVKSGAPLAAVEASEFVQAQSDLSTAASQVKIARIGEARKHALHDAKMDAVEAAHRMNPKAAIVAPIGGVVVDRQVGPGQYLQAGGGTPVFTIADPASVWLLANVRESDAGLVRLGQAVEVHVLAYPTRAFKARVTYVAAVVDPVTHRLPVRAVIENLDGALKAEMFANFRILTSDTSNAPAVPESAVVYEGDLAHVWILSAEGLLA